MLVNSPSSTFELFLHLTICLTKGHTHKIEFAISLCPDGCMQRIDKASLISRGVNLTLIIFPFLTKRKSRFLMFSPQNEVSSFFFSPLFFCSFASLSLLFLESVHICSVNSSRNFETCLFSSLLAPSTNWIICLSSQIAGSKSTSFCDYDVAWVNRLTLNANWRRLFFIFCIALGESYLWLQLLLCALNECPFSSFCLILFVTL